MGVVVDTHSAQPPGRRRICVVGLGIGGAAAALMLHRAGHEVIVLEGSPDPRPIGAGFWLQEAGQTILDRMGLLAELRDQSAAINRIRITTTQRTLLELDYAELPHRLSALGVNRGTLFDVLHRAVQSAGIVVHTGVTVTAVAPGQHGAVVTAADSPVDPDELRGFDLVVAADGRNSAIRDHLRLARIHHDYGWGALWAIVDNPPGESPDELLQVLNGTREYAGLLPTGPKQSSIFWSVRWAEHTGIDLADWRRRASLLLADRGQLLESVTHLIEAHYSHVVVKSLFRCTTEGGREQACVLIGDAAHAMSPQLGVGATLALSDAWSLTGALSTTGSLRQALRLHRSQRLAQVAKYSLGSAAMMPVFQSRLDPVGVVRDRLTPALTRTAAVRRLLLAQLGMDALKGASQ